MFGGLIVNVLNLIPVLPLDGGQIMAACIRQYGPRGVDRYELALKASVAVSAAMCLWAAHCHSSMQPFFPRFLLSWIPGQNPGFYFAYVQPDPQFLAIFMGYLCANSLLALKRF
jgi:Zn-dependent protease